MTELHQGTNPLSREIAASALGRQISADAVDVEGQHRHGRPKGTNFRGSLVSAERLSAGAISSALSLSNTSDSKSSARELAVTSAAGELSSL
jgi:hypothetical protein